MSAGIDTAPKGYRAQVLALLKEKGSVTLDDIVHELGLEGQAGMTPRAHASTIIAQARKTGGDPAWRRVVKGSDRGTFTLKRSPRTIPAPASVSSPRRTTAPVGDWELVTEQDGVLILRRRNGQLYTARRLEL